MKWVLGFAFAALGCQRTTPLDPDDPYVQDVANICNVMQLSGAKGMSGADARYTTATWFGSHLKTEQAHRFMVQIQPLLGDAKAKALEDEAHRVGLADCALAKEWRSP